MRADMYVIGIVCIVALTVVAMIIVMEWINDWRNRRILRSYKNYSDDPFIIEPGQTVEFYGRWGETDLGGGQAKLVKMEIFDSEGKKIGSNHYTD